MKRKFSEIEDKLQSQQRNASNKRRKMDKIKSPLFEHELDQFRFQEIYKLLQESKLLKNIQMDIGWNILNVVQ